MHETPHARRGIEVFSGADVSLRCPECRHVGTFSSIQAVADVIVQDGGDWLGIRWCPNDACRALVFVIASFGNQVIQSYPPELIDFDATNLPAPIVASLEEAVACHAAACYRASALMIRRTLEELCKDRAAAGKNLQDRLKALAGTIVVPAELFDGLDNLRMLGNDAAHVESKDFDEVGADEVELAIAITKEVLKGVYQYSALIEQLKALKTKTAEAGGGTEA